MSIGIQEIALILIVALILFDEKRIPELAKAFGRASYEFKKAKESLRKEIEETENTPDIAEDGSENNAEETQENS